MRPDASGYSSRHCFVLGLHLGRQFKAAMSANTRSVAYGRERKRSALTAWCSAIRTFRRLERCAA
jgi:hypothetical protein